MGHKILNTIGEKFTPEARAILDIIGTVDYHTPSQNELAKVIEDYDIALIGLGLTFNKEVLQGATKLKVIAVPATGLDHIETSYAESHGITILSLKGETDFLNSITGTAELAFGLMIDLMRMSPWAFEDVKDYRWDREQFRGHNLYGATLGIVGMGRLGSWMARYGRAAGMNVFFFDPFVMDSPVKECKRTDFKTLLQKSDVISVHVPLSNETKHLIDKKVLSAIKKSAYLINTSRGEVVDEAALLRALERGNIAGYGTDVLVGENAFSSEGFSNYPLVEYAKKNRNCIIVPHLGGMTVESRSRTDIFIAEKLKKFLQSQK